MSKKLLVVASMLALVACSDNKGRVGAGSPGSKGKDGTGCSVSTIPGGVKIECTDGSEAVVLNGASVKGDPGKNGKDGISVVGPTGPAGKDGKDGKSIVGPQGPPGKDAVCSSNIPGPRGPAGPPGKDGKDGKDGTCNEHDHDYDDNGHQKYFICHLSESGKWISLKLSKEGYLSHMKEHKHDFDGICNKADLCHFEH